MKKVSVIIPLYNQAEYLNEAINSVLASTYSNVEIIVVNDGSTDIYVEQLKEQLPKSVILINTDNNGVCTARNEGIKIATGEYILTLDADDKILPQFIEKAVVTMQENTDIGIVYSKAEYFGDKSGEWFLPQYKKEEFLVHNCIQSCAMFLKKDWEAVGGYKPAMKHGGEDWEFWISLVELGKIPYRIEEPLFYYRKHSKSMTAYNYDKKYFSILKRIIKLHTDLYLNHLDGIIFRLFFAYYKEWTFLLQLKTVIALIKRSIIYPVSKIINRRKIKNILNNLRYLMLNYNNYQIQRKYQNVLKKLKKKSQINVVFLCSEISKWNYQSLYDRFEQSSFVNPIVIVFPLVSVHNCLDNTRSSLQETFDFFHKRNMKVDYGYKNNKYINLKQYNPDIIFYEQHYDLPIQFSIKTVSDYSLCFYAPYGYEILDFKENYLPFFHKRLFKYFVEVPEQITRYEKYKTHNSLNCIVTGNIKMDEYSNDIQDYKSDKIRIIYAPHHSLDEEGLQFSTFDWSYKLILELAKKYQDITIWTYKPHPRLKYAVLYNNIMNEQEYDNYCKEWENIGSVDTQGNYFQLFYNSDCMITDSISFLAEYLPSKKPIIQIVNPRHFAYNKIGKQIEEVLYKAYNPNDIQQIFDDVVLQKNDILFEKRQLVSEYIYNKNKNASEIIYEYIINLLGKK